MDVCLNGITLFIQLNLKLRWNNQIVNMSKVIAPFITPKPHLTCNIPVYPDAYAICMAYIRVLLKSGMWYTLQLKKSKYK